MSVLEQFAVTTSNQKGGWLLVQTLSTHATFNEAYAEFARLITADARFDQAQIIDIEFDVIQEWRRGDNFRRAIIHTTTADAAWDAYHASWLDIPVFQQTLQAAL